MSGRRRTEWPASRKRRYVCKGCKCPYYKATEPQCIFCDSNEFSSLRLSFPDALSRRAYQDAHCSNDYEQCSVFKIFKCNE